MPRSFSSEALATLRILPRKRQDRLILAVARLFGGAARRIALDEEYLAACGGVAATVGEFARQPQPAGCGFAQFFLFAAVDSFFRPQNHRFEQAIGRGRIAAQEVIKMVFEGGFDQPLRLDRSEFLLGLTLELRLSNKNRQQHHRPGHNIFGGDQGGAAATDPLPVRPQAAGQGAPQAGLVGAALGRRDGVAIAVELRLRLLLARPGDRPFHPAGVVAEIRLSDEGGGDQKLLLAGQGLEIVSEAARKSNGLGQWHGGVAGKFWGDAPANLDPLEEVGARPRHPIENRRIETGIGTKNRQIRRKFDKGTLLAAHRLKLLQRSLRLTARIVLPPMALIAKDRNRQSLGQGIDDRNPNPVQTAAGLV